MDSDTSTRRVLLIEDEPDIVRGLRDALTFEGFDVLAARLGSEGVSLARQKSPHIILLDLMLPDINGYQVCESIRAFDQSVPIIMLTARSEEAAKIRGLDAGADDYVTKPFSVGELLARINAIFRRLGNIQDHQQTPSLQIGSALIDLRKHSLERNRRSELLSFYEVELIRMLHERVGEPVSRSELLEKIWGLDALPNNRSVDNFVVKLRKKIEDDSKNPKHILTVYGYGYKLVL